MSGEPLERILKQYSCAMGCASFIAMAKLKRFTQAGSRMAHGTQSASDTRAILQYIDTVLLDVHARCSRPQ